MRAALVAVIALAACDKGKQDAAGGDPPSRVNASKTGAKKGATPEEFCDAYYAKGGFTFRLPALAGPAAAPPPPPAGTWRWVNVWATWCKPCVEEMPRIRAWRDKLAAAGTQVELVFVSIDETDAEIAEFRTRHPEAPASLRVAEPAKSSAWFRELGLTGEPPIPVHFFVDPANHVRCARAGGVREQDQAVVEKLFVP